MNYDTLGFSISQLNEDAGAVSKYYTEYSAALAEFKANGDSLAAKWTGDESGIVTAFNEKLKTAKDALEAAAELMGQLNTLLTTKAGEFESAAAAAKALF